MTGFRNPIVAGINLIREAIRSPNYVTGVQGWTINKDGSSEFSDSLIRGMVTAGDLAGSHIIIDPNVAVAFNDGLLEAVIRMFPDDPNFMMEGMLGVVTFDALQVNAQMSTVIHSPIGTRGFGIVLASDSDDMSVAATGSLGPVTLDGMAMTYVPVLTVETYAVTAEAFLAYGDPTGMIVQAFGTPGVTNWTAPDGVTSVKVECWGGGGSGADPSGPGGGGGGGEYASQTVVVTPGNVYPVTVGAGSSTAASGGLSRFVGDAVTVTANGGHSSTTAAGAAGGSGSTNTIHHSGGTGGTTNPATSSGGSGGGGAGGTTAAGGTGGNGQPSSSGGVSGIGGVTGGGAGGKGGNSGLSGFNGSAPGGGGGGVGSGGSNAGDGADGVVRLTYTPPASAIVASMAGTAGVDKFGNAYPAGMAVNSHGVLDNHLVRRYSTGQTGNVALAAGGFANLTGMSIAFTTFQPNAECHMDATFDTNCTAAGVAGDLALYQALLDGVPILGAGGTYTPYADIRAIGRTLVPGTWDFVVAAAGAHTITFQGRKTAGSAATVSALTSVAQAGVVVIDNNGGV